MNTATQAAMRCFQENLHLVRERPDQTEESNLYNGLAQMTEAIEALANDVETIRAESICDLQFRRDTKDLTKRWSEPLTGPMHTQPLTDSTTPNANLPTAPTPTGFAEIISDDFPQPLTSGSDPRLR